jgi:hypothetical protein
VKRFFVAAAVCALALTVSEAPAAAADEAVIREVLAILKERGIVDEARYGELVAKSEAYEAKQASLLSRVVWTGDFRGRFESFWFDEDPLGNEAENRNRARYRLRLGAVIPINDWFTAGFRLASGETENRSTNRTLGRGLDFDRDAIDIDEAYLQLKLPLDGSNASLVFGKQSNPFLWKNGKDYMVWDPDYSPEGISARWTMEASPTLGLFGNAGYFLIQEEGGAKDPHFYALQAGGRLQAADEVALGTRLTWYSYHSLNAGFFTRQDLFGNVGLSDDPDDGLDQIELSAYAQSTHFAEWPLLLHAHYAKNLDAAAIPGAGEQDTGWGVALEVGDAKQVVLLGVGYYALEADFAPALYIDSDLTDGFTNREGWTLYGTRQIFPNTELTLELFVSDPIDESAPFAISVADSERIRFRTDVLVKF